MKCIYCGQPLASIAYCPGCGADVTLLKRIGRISNLLYNRGLEKAQVRDLSGAISVLHRSLKFNKENIDARNLLGLCYYETGEVVSALCEWVVSKNMQPGDNPATYYMEELQSNKNQLDTINQSIRKYNQSIEYCRQGHDDMALMQLKKVVASNPKLVRAHQMLALLYIRNQEYEKARRVLRKAAAIDNTNTTTLRYLNEIEESTGKGSGRRRRRDAAESTRTAEGTFSYMSGTDTIIQPTTFRDSSTVATFINIGLGVLLGGAIIWFMAVPENRQRTQERANQFVADANQKLASGTAQLQELQNEIDSYTAQVDTANQERDAALAKAEGYDELMAAASMYVRGEQSAAVDSIGKIDAASLDGSAKALYDDLLDNVSTAMFNDYYTAGTTAYVAQDYKTAAEQLKLAVEADPEGTEANAYNALLYLGFAYYNQGDYVNSDATFNELIEKYPGQAYQVQGYLTGSWGTGSSSNGTATQGEVSMNQDAGDITVYDDQGTTYDPSLVAWTDPYTGRHYDMYGNPLD